MGLAQYAIVPVRDQWGVLHDGNVNGEYATEESAFEICNRRSFPGDTDGARGACKRTGTP